MTSVGVSANNYGPSPTTEVAVEACQVYNGGGSSCGSQTTAAHGAGEVILTPSTSAWLAGYNDSGYMLLITLAPQDASGSANQINAYSVTPRER